jgi:RND superfamily putative drug exporter
MKALTTWVLAHKKIVVIGWLLLLVIGIGTNTATNDRLNQKFTVPGKEAQATNAKIVKNFGNGGESAPVLAVVKLPKPASQERAQLGALEKRISTNLHGSRVAGYASTGSKTFLSKDGLTSFVVVHPRPDPDTEFGENTVVTKQLRKVIGDSKVDGATVRVTGVDALTEDAGGEANSGGTTLLVETLGTVVLALGVLVFVFGSPLAFLPIVVAMFSIMSTFAALFVVTRFSHLSSVVAFLVYLVGLGVAIDYALLMTIRWREERTHGHENEDALIIAGEHAGRAIVFSGITVAIGLVSMVAIPLPFMRSIGIAGMLIPTFSVLVAITLLPVLLSKWGPWLDKHRVRSDDKASAAWTNWAKLIVRFRWLAATVAILILGFLIFSATSLQFGIGNLNTLAKKGDSVVALNQLKDSGIGSGALLPHEILVTGGNSTAVANAAASVKDVYGAVAPASWHKGDLSIVNAFTTPDPSTGAGENTVDGVRSAVSDNATVGGQIAATSDYVDATYSYFPVVLIIMSIITFILLARAFRSVLLPIKAIVLNLISILAAWGILEIVWQAGHGSSLIWGIAATGSIVGWVPLMVFAFLFGLSMDYEVFILSRMREVYDKTGDTNEAVIQGIGRTGRLVTSAALILFFAFGALATAPETDTKVIATGLAAGILLDATVIRALFVPAVVSLFGRANWWMPAGLARLLRVEPSGG